MAIEILMPALSPTMEEGTLAKWLVKEGDTVSSGDIMAEIETDKATMEFEAVDEGTIGKILIDAGTEGVKVNTPIAVLLEEGEDASDIDSASSAAPAEQPKADDSDDAKSDKAPAAAKPDAEAPKAPETDTTPDWPEGTAMKQQTVREALAQQEEGEAFNWGAMKLPLSALMRDIDEAPAQNIANRRQLIENLREEFNHPQLNGALNKMDAGLEAAQQGIIQGGGK